MRMTAGLVAFCVAVTPTSWGAEPTASKRESKAAERACADNQGVQCGFHATVFALEYLAVDYSVTTMTTGLRVPAEGSSLAEIQEVLRAFGLDASVREGVTLKQVAKALDRDTLAIVPLPVEKRLNHYFVAAMGDDGRSVMADVPYRTFPLPDADAERRLEATGGVVLFVRRPGKRDDAMRDRIRGSPTRLDLGEFMIAGPKAVSELSASVSISNVSESPIMVSKIQAPCTCIKVDWQGGILRPKETRQLGLTVTTQPWGRGEREKLVLLTLGDGSKFPVRLHGVGMTPTEQQHLELSQESVEVDVTDRPMQIPVDVRVAKVRAVEMSLDKVSLASRSPWLSPRLVPTEKAAGELWVKVDVGRVTPELGKSSNRVTGTVTLSTQSNDAPAGVQVSVFRRDAFRLSQSVVRIRRGETCKVAILPSRQGDRLNLKNVQSDSAWLSVEAKEEEEGITLAVGIGTKAVKPGYYLVKCTLDSSTAKSETATLAVQVVP